MSEETVKILDILESINKIPRKSKNRGPICNYLKNWAETNGFKYKEDHVQNLNIFIPASEGFENSPLIALQGHSDMVCEKVPESDHDFSKDPIVHQIEGDWLSAKDTSLGADNGIGLAMSMLVATDKNILHPALELIFTTDEEIGLWGADEIKSGFIDSKILINLDSEELGVFTLGCAGAAINHLDFSFKRVKPSPSMAACQLHLGGFRGGHSGADIHRNRGNATFELIRGLASLNKKIPYQIGEINGGSAMNAISRSATAIIVVEKTLISEVEHFWDEFVKIVIAEHKIVEENAFGEFSKVNLPQKVFSIDDSSNLLLKARLIPHGVQYMNAALPDQVETSMNFGVIKTTEQGFRLTLMERGSLKSRLVELCDRIETFAKVLDADYTLETFMDPWQPNWDSSLVKHSTKLWKELFNEEAKLEVTHGALECGVIGNLTGRMEMISFGPDIEDPHSPDERLKISSVGVSFKFLVELLKSLK